MYVHDDDCRCRYRWFSTIIVAVVVDAVAGAAVAAAAAAAIVVAVAYLKGWLAGWMAVCLLSADNSWPLIIIPIQPFFFKCQFFTVSNWYYRLCWNFFSKIYLNFTTAMAISAVINDKRELFIGS